MNTGTTLQTGLVTAALITLAASSAAMGEATSQAQATTQDQRAAAGRLEVDVTDLRVSQRPNEVFIGTLFRGQSFRVDRLSASGRYAYGLAYGRVNRRGWVRTSGLDTAAGGSDDELRLDGTPSALRDGAEQPAGPLREADRRPADQPPDR